MYLSNEFVFAIYDGFPISKGHTLIIPIRHLQSFFDLSTAFDLSGGRQTRLEFLELFEKVAAAVAG
ncbi:MAG: HIT domain-containing protein [Gammaproteobacteria bacterium]|nr:HIT domain-containing protein [Pseudomonadales bacterium]